ncbi:MAG: ABC transporter ATP-binding protein [Fusobacterium sp.]|uniref:ABC transporter ATP-binding protein n=1 Tax=Fusobacterium sp. TaxID=68766 RepID=UPI0026DB800F|nr:ABC transporter ATP-binding protein [Fusobacterium sp.]MDO4691173.1 ABC transporter ATP-binding protein [Fusobacterium sp.]
MILEVKNVYFQYKGERATLNNINLKVKKGEILSILGVNGAGKSTLFRLIMGILAPLKGEIRLEGQKLETYSIKEIAKKIGYVKQYNDSSYEYRVKDFLLMGRAPHLGLFENPKKEDWDIVYQVMDKIKISHLADRNMNELSGGENQLIFLGRTLVQDPKIILLDEPTNHLDLGNQYKILKILKKLSSEGYTILMTTHLPDHVILLGGKVGIINNQGEFKYGTAEEMLTEETLKNIYKTPLKKVYVSDLDREVCTFKKI